MVKGNMMCEAMRRWIMYMHSIFCTSSHNQVIKFSIKMEKKGTMNSEMQIAVVSGELIIQSVAKRAISEKRQLELSRHCRALIQPGADVRVDDPARASEHFGSELGIRCRWEGVLTPSAIRARCSLPVLLLPSRRSSSLFLLFFFSLSLVADGLTRL